MDTFLKTLSDSRRVAVPQRPRNDYEREYSHVKGEVDKIVSRGLKRLKRFEQLRYEDSDGTLKFPGFAKCKSPFLF
jgi:hypothetical protein